MTSSFFNNRVTDVLLSSTSIGGSVGLVAGIATAASIYHIGVGPTALVPPLLGCAAILGGVCLISYNGKKYNDNFGTPTLLAGAVALLGSIGNMHTKTEVNSSVCIPFNTETQVILDQYPNLWPNDSLENAFKKIITTEIDAAYRTSIHPLAIRPNESEFENGGAVLTTSYMPFKDIQSKETQICDTNIRHKFMTANLDRDKVVSNIQGTFQKMLNIHVSKLRMTP